MNANKDNMTDASKNLPAPDVLPVIRLIRNQRVILDTDLARLYGVPTKALNQAVKRNRERFPEEFMFQLSWDEVSSLRSQIVTLKPGMHQKYRPFAFTEHGALMASTILNSPRAVAMSVYIIRAFVKMREDLAANSAVLKRLAEIDKTLLIHDVALRDILQKLRPLLEPPPLPPKPEIGFHSKEDAITYRIRRKVRS
jgi:ORF6N domain.